MIRSLVFALALAGTIPASAAAQSTIPGTLRDMSWVRVWLANRDSPTPQGLGDPMSVWADSLQAASQIPVRSSFRPDIYGGRSAGRSTEGAPLGRLAQTVVGALERAGREVGWPCCGRGALEREARHLLVLTAFETAAGLASGATGPSR
jgi:hypothetical protein